MLNSRTIAQAKRYCKSDIKEIEGYNEAVNSDKRYCCHHRNGLNVSREDLIEKGLYYDRPASELIFLEFGEHSRLHNKGKIGENSPMYGKHHTEETKKKQSDALKNRYFSDEHRRKISDSMKGKNKGKFTGAKNHKAKRCTINGTAYGCLKDAYEDIKPAYSYSNFIIKYRNNKL